MKYNNILTERRKSISKDIRDEIEISFSIVDRIHEILKHQGKTQKDLANLLGKSESEISKWMRGTHNFTISTIVRIENVLGEKILAVMNGLESGKQIICIPLFNVPFIQDINPKHSKPISKDTNLYSKY